jgi:hypothetical protein
MYAFFKFRKTVGSARGPYVHIRILFLRMNRSHRPKVQCLRGVFVIVDSICFQAFPLWKGNFWPYHRMTGVWDWKQTQQIVHPERWRWQRTENGTSACCLERGEPTKSWFRTGHSASIWSTWNQRDNLVFRDATTSSGMTYVLQFGLSISRCGQHKSLWYWGQLSEFSEALTIVAFSRSPQEAQAEDVKFQLRGDDHVHGEHRCDHHPSR